MASEMDISPTASSATVEDGLTTRDDQSMSGLSQDDLDAAQALEDLRRDSRKSPPSDGISKVEPAYIPNRSSDQPEPLLSLLTSHHPTLSNAITGSLSAYSSSKDYSPSFKYSAEFIERLGSPVVSTVGTAGRISGVESGVRWWLKRPAGQRGDRNNKRGRVHGHPDQDLEKGFQAPVDQSPVNRSLSVGSSETLPAYDDYRSPQYVEFESSQPVEGEEGRPRSQTWSSRLILSTSGLSIAMRPESLSTLRFCLRWTRWGNTHLRRILASVRDLLGEESNDQQESTADAEDDGAVAGSSASAHETHEATRSSQASPLATHSTEDHERRLTAITREVREIIRQVTCIVSSYAGSALPNNVREAVRTCLVSFPQRLAARARQHERTFSRTHPTWALYQAQRLALIIREGLDIMAQLSWMLNGTINHAEGWVLRLSRQRDNRSPNGTATGNQLQRLHINGHHDQVDGHSPPATALSMQTDQTQVYNSGHPSQVTDQVAQANVQSPQADS